MRFNFKVILGLGLVVLILLGIGGWLLLAGQGGEKKDNKDSINETSKVKNTKSDSKSSGNKLITQKTDVGVEVSYPTDWKLTSKKIVGNGGFYTQIKPSGVVEESPLIMIQATDAVKASLSQTEGVFRALGYQQDKIEVKGIPATKFRGTIGNQSKKLHETAVVLENEDKVYLIKISYASEDESERYESLFDEFLANLKF